MTPEELATVIKTDTTGRYVERQMWHCEECHARRAIAWVFGELQDGEIIANFIMLGAHYGPRQDGEGGIEHPPTAHRLELRPGVWLAHCPRCRAARLLTATPHGQRLEIELRDDVEFGAPTWAVVTDD